MNNSIFDVFKIGIGPSSSHTIGPMVACNMFIDKCKSLDNIKMISQVKVTLFGSLASTGIGHCTDKAIILGLSGELPHKIKQDDIKTIYEKNKIDNKLQFGKEKEIFFSLTEDIEYCYKKLKEHSNALKIQAFAVDQKKIVEEVYFSIGGGVIKTKDEINQQKSINLKSTYSFENASEIFLDLKKRNISIYKYVLFNELKFLSFNTIHQKLTLIWKTMEETVKRGCVNTDTLPGKLRLERRAHKIYKKLLNEQKSSKFEFINTMDWVNLFAIAVNEENASGSRVVTAPTNGAAGIIPSVLSYYDRFYEEKIPYYHEKFIMVAGFIGIIYKKFASISGAEVGCQGEVGVACSMAAAALTAICNGSIDQIEQAAEIGMEHNLGLTCDPIAGLVQIPCIERNAMAAIKAINASRIALQTDGNYYISLDHVIKTMYITGKDMQSKYKETSLGGLASGNFRLKN